LHEKLRTTQNDQEGVGDLVSIGCKKNMG
jgi:hypothetical protein